MIKRDQTFNRFDIESFKNLMGCHLTAKSSTKNLFMCARSMTEYPRAPTIFPYVDTAHMAHCAQKGGLKKNINRICVMINHCLGQPHNL